MKKEQQLLTHFHFVIGEQLENYEFDLIAIEDITINAITYERYLYKDKVSKQLFNIVPKRIILYFNVDVLCEVHFYFNSDFFNFFINKIKRYKIDFNRMDEKIYCVLIHNVNLVINVGLETHVKLY